ncbi:hypothetical protein JYQ62_10990 [Nostoc sp. UHCC 0702]|nr:hypothetical protein JYQ62_10990 [Nostoc sp. UHCC 0702]
MNDQFDLLFGNLGNISKERSPLQLTTSDRPISLLKNHLHILSFDNVIDVDVSGTGFVASKIEDCVCVLRRLYSSITLSETVGEKTIIAIRTSVSTAPP